MQDSFFADTFHQFCNRCRWLHRATWVQTELFLTFPDIQAEEASDGKEPGGKYATAGKGIKAITLIPCNAPDTGGRFRVWLYTGKGSSTAQQQRQQRDNGSSESREGVYEDGKVVLLWDRKIKGGFPELKDLVSGTKQEKQCLAPSDPSSNPNRNKE
jgi:selT/selW/selH-like putative selenoprotein